MAFSSNPTLPELSKLSNGKMDLDECRCDSSGSGPTPLCEIIDNDSVKDSSFIRQRARGISEAWKRTLAKRDNRSILKGGEKRPSLSVKKLKHEIAAVLTSELSSASDKNVYELVQNMLFLLYEAELHKKMLHLDCKRLRDLCERDMKVIRELHAKQNIPIAITNSILDARILSSGTASVDAGESASPITSDENTSSRNSMENPWKTSNVVSRLTSNKNVVLPAQLQTPSISLPDVTKPPPPVPKVATPCLHLSSSLSIQNSAPQTFPVIPPPPAFPSVPSWSPTKPPPSFKNSTPLSAQSTFRPNVTFRYYLCPRPSTNPHYKKFPQAQRGFGGPKLCDYSPGAAPLVEYHEIRR